MTCAAQSCGGDKGPTCTAAPVSGRDHYSPTQAGGRQAGFEAAGGCSAACLSAGDAAAHNRDRGSRRGDDTAATWKGAAFKRCPTRFCGRARSSLSGGHVPLPTAAVLGCGVDSRDCGCVTGRMWQPHHKCVQLSRIDELYGRLTCDPGSRCPAAAVSAKQASPLLRGCTGFDLQKISPPLALAPVYRCGDDIGGGRFWR